MSRYDFKCPNGHVTELEFPIGKAPDEIDCLDQPELLQDIDQCWCALRAKRQIATGTSFLVNKVMLPPSKRSRMIAKDVL